jgi:hypothetical protein
MRAQNRDKLAEMVSGLGKGTTGSGSKAAWTGGWTFMALAFTLTLVVVTLTGSIWVMYHLDQNMMPMSPHEALQKP